MSEETTGGALRILWNKVPAGVKSAMATSAVAGIAAFVGVGASGLPARVDDGAAKDAAARVVSDSLVAVRSRLESMELRQVETDSIARAGFKGASYSACRMRRSDRGLSLERCEEILDPQDYLAPSRGDR